jgi:hypothetical protein
MNMEENRREMKIEDEFEEIHENFAPEDDEELDGYIDEVPVVKTYEYKGKGASSASSFDFSVSSVFLSLMNKPGVLEFTGLGFLIGFFYLLSRVGGSDETKDEKKKKKKAK